MEIAGRRALLGNSVLAPASVTRAERTSKAGEDVETAHPRPFSVEINPTDIHTRAIIKHELAHIRLGHSWDMLLCELTCRMLWFVPFAWMLRQDLRDVHEYQADAQVLQGGIRDEVFYQKASYFWSVFC